MDGLHVLEREIKENITKYWEEESAFKQKFRDQIISLGDSNTTYFYGLMKILRHRNSISSIRNTQVNLVMGDAVYKEAELFYKPLLAPVLLERPEPISQFVRFC